jgi:hypothetical protein
MSIVRHPLVRLAAFALLDFAIAFDGAGSGAAKDADAFVALLRFRASSTAIRGFFRAAAALLPFLLYQLVTRDAWAVLRRRGGAREAVGTLQLCLIAGALAASSLVLKPVSARLVALADVGQLTVAHVDAAAAAMRPAAALNLLLNAGMLAVPFAKASIAAREAAAGAAAAKDAAASGRRLKRDSAGSAPGDDPTSGDSVTTAAGSSGVDTVGEGGVRRRPLAASTE